MLGIRTPNRYYLLNFYVVVLLISVTILGPLEVLKQYSLLVSVAPIKSINKNPNCLLSSFHVCREKKVVFPRDDQDNYNSSSGSPFLL